jgi:hypothetical protein
VKYVIALIAALAVASPALAQHKHSHSHAEKGPNGGPMEDVAGVHAELIVAGKTLTLNILDEGENALKGDAKAAIAKGANITVTLKTAAAKSGQAKFKAP